MKKYIRFIVAIIYIPFGLLTFLIVGSIFVTVDYLADEDLSMASDLWENIIPTNWLTLRNLK